MKIVQKMAWKNLQRRPVRSWCMIFFVFMLAASLFLCSVLTESMQGNLDKSIDRMGADVIVVPKEYQRDMADALFLGEKCDFTFDKKWISEITSLDGVKQASPQLYLQSLAAGCCSTEVQLIAFDPETDFIVKAWLEDDGIKMPEYGEMIVGCQITPENGEDGPEVYFFDNPYKVVGQLEPTRTNYDICVFMTYETAQSIMDSPKWYEAFRTNPVADELVSSLMIRVDEAFDPKVLAREINFHLAKDSPVSAYTTNGIMSDAIENVASMSSYTYVLTILVSILVIAALICIFTITINERTKEFGILASLGASSGKLCAIVLTEGVLIGLVGGLLGVGFSTVVLLIFKGTMETLLNLPNLYTNIAFLGGLAGKCLLLSLVISVLASLYSAWKVSRNDLDKLIRGEEM